jgi:exosortase
MTATANRTVAIALVVAGLAVLYWRVLGALVDAWVNDGNYSHGFLIVPIAAYFVWERRARLRALPTRGSWLGLIVFGVGILILLAGLLGSELFLSRTSLLVVLAGIVIFLFGWAHLRALLFPLAFLVLMIPIPALIFNQIAFPLQLLASRVGETVISACNIPVYREGNVLVLANTSLEVAEACSGIRSLVSLITLGIVYSYFTDTRAWVRITLVLTTIPVAVIANGARVAGTGVLAHFYGPAAAEGFFHEFSGWVVFIVAFMLVFAIQKLLVRFAPRRDAPTVPAPAA